MSSIKGKVAIVTGGSRGIGRGIVLELAQSGCHVAFNYHKNKEAAQKLVKEAQSLGVKVLAAGVDIRDFDQVKKWVDQVKQELGRLDILVNNAGITNDKALMMMTKDDWDDVIGTNLTGTFNASRACIVTFLKQKSGDIINISSASGLTGLDRQANYSASKGGVNAFTKALAKEVAGFGVRVNAIAPGYIETDMLQQFNDEQKAKILAKIPVGRLGKIDDVCACVSFLLGEEARYITGQVISVDGGLVMR